MATTPERTLSHWDPIAELDWFRNPFLVRRDSGVPRSGTERGFSPAIDVSEDDARYIVTAEIPGTDRDDITVEVHGGTLTIRGEKRNEREEHDEHRSFVERSFGTFSRSFTLPTNADNSKVDASFDAGVLTVTIAKSDEAKPRTVAIKS